MSRTLIVIGACLLLANAPVQLQAKTLDESIEAVVGKLANFLRGQGETAISIGQFHGPPQLGTSSGPNIAQLFRDHFTQYEIAVKRRCKLGLNGEYSLSDGGEGNVAVRLDCRLKDLRGQILTDFSVEAQLVDKHEDVVELLGVTAHLFAEDTHADRSEDIKRRVLTPKVHVAGTKCYASSESPYAMEILVRGRALPVKLDEGLGFVHLEHHDIYRIRLYNDSDHEAAVRLSIDGLNVFTFSEIRNSQTGAPKYSYYIIAPHGSIDLVGWHRTNSHVDSFLVTGYAKSAAASISHQQDIGTITATFAASWPKHGNPPPDEDLTDRGDKATGFGPPVKQTTREVERNIGRLRAAVSIRYDK